MMQDDGQKIEGIYFEIKNLEVGTMGTSKDDGSGHELHWHAGELDDNKIGLYFIRPDRSIANFAADTIDRQEFFERFNECSIHGCEFQNKTDEERDKEAVEKQIAIAEEHLEKQEYHSASFEFGKALKKDDSNLKANLGKGKAHVALGEVDKAKQHFSKMSNNSELFDHSNKHIFNDLGITMRKNGMLQDSIGNYKKALELAPEDEVLHFNMARVQHESGNKAEALEHLIKAVKLNPNFPEAKAYYQVIKAAK